MRNPLKKQITKEISAWFLLLAVLPLALGTVLGQITNRRALIAERTAHLKDISHEKVERLELYVQEHKLSVQTLAASPTLIEAMKAACDLFCAPGHPSPPSLQQSGTAYTFLTQTRQRFGYHDIFLINQTGDVVFTLAREKDLATNLRTGPYRASGLAKVFDTALTLLDSDISSFSYYPPSGKAAAFLAAPVLDGRKMVGVIAVQLNEDRLFYIFSDYLGLGESGELVAGKLREDGSIVAAGPLRHRPDALDKGLVLNEKSALPIRLAALGQQGAGFAVDYRGREVLAAWQYVPSLAWGLVVKIDRAEALAPVRHQELIAGGALLAALLLVLTGILFATTTITAPLKQLIATVRRFAGGDFAARSEINSVNEVGVLAQAFNDMAHTIEEYTFTMEQQVARRTEELQRAKDSLDRAQAVAHLGSWQWDIPTNNLSWSDEIYRIFGLAPQQFAATYDAFLEAVHPEDRKLVTNAVQASLETGSPYSIDHRVKRPDGEIRIVHELAEIKRDADGAPVAMLGTVQDVTELRRAQQQLQQYIAIVDDNVITSTTDPEGNITHASNAFCRVSAYDRTELIGRNHRLVRHPDMPADIYENLWKTITGGGVWQGVIKNKTRDNRDYWVEISISPVFDDRGAITGYTAIHHDITDKKRIEDLSITDELTGLYNRRHFNRVFPQELNRARRDGRPFAFVMLDVDHFKNYNDTYGHQEGDEVLRQVGKVLKQELRRSGDFAFRLGGEEFGAVLAIRNRQEALAVTEKLRRAIAALAIPHAKNSAAAVVTISAGLSLTEEEPGTETAPDVLYRQADAALYQAKENGRNQVACHPEEA